MPGVTLTVVRRKSVAMTTTCDAMVELGERVRDESVGEKTRWDAKGRSRDGKTLGEVRMSGERLGLGTRDSRVAVML